MAVARIFFAAQQRDTIPLAARQHALDSLTELRRCGNLCVEHMPLGVVEPAADRHDVVLGSVRPDRAHLDVEHGVLCECLLRRVVDARTVGLVHRVEKSVVSHFRRGRQAEKGEAFRRPVQIAADHVPVPRAEVRAGHRQPQPLFGRLAIIHCDEQPAVELLEVVIE